MTKTVEAKQFANEAASIPSIDMETATPKKKGTGGTQVLHRVCATEVLELCWNPENPHGYTKKHWAKGDNKPYVRREKFVWFPVCPDKVKITCWEDFVVFATENRKYTRGPYKP